MMYGKWHVWALVGAIAGCSGSSSGDTTSAKITLASTALQMNPGQETYMCWNATIPDGPPLAITALDPHIPQTAHHYVVLIGLAPDGTPSPLLASHPDGEAFECSNASLLPWLAVGGTGAPPVKFPEGTAMKLSAGTRVALQLHLLNAQDKPITMPVATLDLATSTNVDDYQRIGLFNAATGQIHVPPKTSNFDVKASCPVDKKMEHVFTVYPHMHLIGRHIKTEITQGGGTRSVNEIDWNFYKQLMYPVDASLGAGDTVTVTCTYDNPRDTAVNFGQSSNDEMCSSVVYYYPADTTYESCGGPPAGVPPGKP